MDEHALERLDFARVRELLAACALTGLGRSLAGAIRPASRIELVQRWLAQVEELIRQEPEHGLPPMAGVSDVREIVLRCAPPLRVSAEDLARVGDTLNATHHVTAYLAQAPEDCPELRHLAQRIGDFRTLADRVRGVIDERGQVRDSASPKLASIRHAIEQSSVQIRRVVERLLHAPDVRRLLQFGNYTFHNDRLVLPVRTEYRGRLPGIIHRGSDSGATLYIEPAEAVELNNHISSLRVEEGEEIARLLWELAHEVHINEAGILRTLDALAVLDLIAAKVRLARQLGLRCPRVTDEPVLEVREARHPLLMELARQRALAGQPAEAVVAIHYRLGSDFNLLVITGPNTGGKTVTLKTIGLLTMMVQAGIPAPVGEGSHFGIFRNVLIDVGDEQSLQQSLSTFSGHLRQQLDMLRQAGNRTLVLIDELGAGTDPDEGAAIGRALLDEFLRMECRCVVTTHLGALKNYAHTRPRVENACVEFDEQTLRPTYHLRIGEPGMSNAIAIAQRLGMPRRLVQAAQNNLSRRARTMRAALEDAAVVKRQAEQAREKAVEAQLEADRAQQAAREARVQLDRRQADFETWVQRVVHLRPGDMVRVRNFDRDGRIVRMRIDLQRAEVDVGAFSVEVPLGDVLPPETPPPPPRAPRPARVESLESRPVPPRPTGPRGERGRQGGRPPSGTHAPGSAEAGPRRRPGEADRPPAHPSLTDAQAAALQPGDLVYAKRFHRQGRLVRVHAAKKLAVVSVGLLEVEVPFSGLAMPGAEDGERRRGGAGPRRGDPDTGAKPQPPRESKAAESTPDTAASPD
jgi:DNA mismatch repair protein MutS2